MIGLHADLLGERASLTPDKTALVFVPTGERFTYRQLDERAARMARFLSAPGGLGLSKGDRAGLLANNSVEFLDVFFGAIKAGVVVVPLGTRLTPRELAHVARDSGMAALLYGPEHSVTIRALAAEAPLPRGVLLAAGERALAEDLSWPGERERHDAAGFARTQCGPEDLCALLYTSGTTGRPKGVMVPHRMVAWNAIGTALGWQLREEDVSPIFTPLYHAGGLGAFLMPVFAIGGTVVLPAGFDAEEVLLLLTVVREALR